MVTSERNFRGVFTKNKIYEEDYIENYIKS